MQFENDQAIVSFALKNLQSTLDPDELLCSETPSLNRASLKSQKGKRIFG